MHVRSLMYINLYLTIDSHLFFGGTDSFDKLSEPTNFIDCSVFNYRLRHTYSVHRDCAHASMRKHFCALKTLKKNGVFTRLTLLSKRLHVTEKAEITLNNKLLHFCHFSFCFFAFFCWFNVGFAFQICICIQYNIYLYTHYTCAYNSNKSSFNVLSWRIWETTRHSKREYTRKRRMKKKNSFFSFDCLAFV